MDDGKIPTLPNLHTKMNDDIIFDVVTIEQYLNKLPNKFSACLDGIPTVLLKNWPLNLVYLYH